MICRPGWRELADRLPLRATIICAMSLLGAVVFAFGGGAPKTAG